MCSKKSGKYRGCPYRDEGLRCHFTCKCGGKKPCKNNKESNIVRGNLPSSAFDRHRNEERHSSEEIKVCIPNSYNILTSFVILGHLNQEL